MLWELMATLVAGLGAAGIAMFLRHFNRRIGKGMIPAAAGLGMLCFQIYSEYSWLAHTRSRLPPEAHIVAEFPQSAFYKPWSYFWPPVLRFVAVDRQKSIPFAGNPRLLQTYLYFFERRMSAKTWPVVINCESGTQANLAADGRGIEAGGWQQTPYSAAIAAAICPPASAMAVIPPP